MHAVTEFHSMDELANARLTWKHLWEKTRGASYFQSYDWLRSYLRFYGEGLKLKVLLVTIAAKPIGLIPLVVRNVRTQLGSAAVLTFPLGEWGSFYGQVGPNPAATWQGAMPHVLGSKRDWQVVELPGNDDSGPEGTRVSAALKTGGLQVAQTSQIRHPIVDLTEDWDHFLSERSPRCRMQLAQAEHAVQRYGAVSFHRWRPDGLKSGQTDRRWDLLAAVDALKRKSDHSASRAEIELAFLRDAHSSAVDLGVADICTLTVGGRPIAAAYSYATNGLVEPVLFVTDPEIGEAAIQLLHCMMIRDSFLRRDRRIVFRAEHATNAETWANSSVIATTYGHYAWLSPQAQMLRLKQRKAKVVGGMLSVPMSGSADTNSTLRLYAGT